MLTARSLLVAAAMVGVLAGAPAVQGQGSQAPSADYVIGPEDVLEIQVFDNKDLNFGGFVRPDGKISLPLIGEIQAAGKTVQKLQDDLVEIYSRTVKSPVVTVIVRQILSRPVYFVGGFGKTGPLQLTRDLTLMQAVAIMGGVAPGADGENAYLLRGDKRIAIDFEKLLKKGDLSQNLHLEPGDTLVAPVAEVVYLQGEVKIPGVQKYTTDLTILKAITQAGGLTPLAAPGRVDILRGAGEKKVRIRVDVDDMLRKPEETPDMRLRPDDVIFVPQRFF